MNGWSIAVGDGEPEAVREQSATVGIIVDKNFPDEKLRESLAKGVERNPDAVFVVRESDDRAIKALEAVGVEPVLAPLNAYYKVVTKDDRTDVRRIARDTEILSCRRVVVYKDANSEASKWWCDHLKDWTGQRIWGSRLRIVEEGKKQRKRRKGRKLD